jgi:poly-gamma-glutamate capsule biosynthesis protein CapA/YwtB (metallophosphatase superfamily)
VVSRRVRRRRRQFVTVGGLIVLFLIYFAFFSGGSPKNSPVHKHHSEGTPETFPAHSPLNPDWRGDGKAVTLAFGGDVHFESTVGERLSQNPATALGDTVNQLFTGSQVRMVNLESALTQGTCPQPQPKQYIFYAPPTALTALRDASITAVSQANDHALDCGQTGLAQELAVAKGVGFPLVGVGADAAQAFAPYRTTVDGQRIAIIAATQVIAANLTTAWTATSSQPGVASALDPTQLVQAVQAARRTSDTVVVYLHWGTETVACPDPQQEPLAQQLVKAGADIVIGSGAHVLLGGGYLGDAYVDYGLGNLAFYDNTAPETDSGSLLVTMEGRHVTSATFHPATIVGGLPQPLTGTPAATALASWNAARSCTNLSAAPTTSQASERGEATPFVAPATTATTTPAAGTTTPSQATTTTTAGGSTQATTTTTTATKSTTTTTTTTTVPKTTQPTDNAG